MTYLLNRNIEHELINISGDYPVVTVVGPRQSGKTTLVKKVFTKMPYANLEEPDIREYALQDPRGFLGQFPHGAILDEIQRAPQLLSYIQAIVDQTDAKGMFILTGSHQLAGRTALLTLLPLCLNELNAADINLPLDTQLLHGFLPRVYHDNLEPTKAYRNYFQTYVERDVRQLIQVKDLNNFQRFIKLCAGRIGQILNVSGLSNELGVSSHTVNHWLSILEASFIVFRLQPYFENFGKRIIKAPKLYFTDVGLATYLLAIENENQLNRDPLRGNLVENLVILEMLKTRMNQGRDANLYYYRDNHQNEIDIIYRSGNTLVPIEIKSSQTFNTQFLKNLNYFTALAGTRCEQGFVIYAGQQEMQVNNFQIINYLHTWKIFQQ